jgi:hypothetical protein
MFQRRVALAAGFKASELRPGEQQHPGHRQAARLPEQDPAAKSPGPHDPAGAAGALPDPAARASKHGHQQHRVDHPPTRPGPAVRGGGGGVLC